jgi:ribosomal protein S12 methylthiotransferase
MLQNAGFTIVPNAADADVAIVNTCGFIRSAVEENISAILDLVEMKSAGGLKKVGVVGCLVSRYGDEMERGIPEVDFWARCDENDAILSGVSLGPAAPGGGCPTGRHLLPGTAKHVRYLKISEGCDNRCSYCTIPSIKGALRSRPMGEIAGEAVCLARDGAREICLVAQDLTAYGDDLGGGVSLTTLLDELEGALSPDVWLRLFYLHPYRVGRCLLERVANGRQVLPYLDIPIQHSSTRVLGLMNRSAGADNLNRVFEMARAIRPDFALRTTCMVGFPGESRADFDELLRFVERIGFDRLGAFAFSPEEGTPALGLPGQVPERTKKARLARLMSLQEDISLSRQSLFVGREMDAVIDSIDEHGRAEGRSYREAPEVDGVIEFDAGERDLKAGDRVRLLITGAFEHDLAAEIAHEN